MVKKSLSRPCTNGSLHNDSSIESRYLTLKNRELAKNLAQMKVTCTQFLTERDLLQKDLFAQTQTNNTNVQRLNAVRELCETCVQHMLELSNVVTNIMRMATVSENPPNRSVAGESANMSGRSFVNNTARNKMHVVRPMVSGHTISNPTIKLSRITEDLHLNQVHEPQQPSTSANDSEISMSLSEDEAEQTPQENVTPSVENARLNTLTEEDEDTNVTTTTTENINAEPEHATQNGLIREPYVQLMRSVTPQRPSLPRMMDVDDPGEGPSGLVHHTEVDFEHFSRLSGGGDMPDGMAQTSTPYFVTQRVKRETVSSASFRSVNSLSDSNASVGSPTRFVTKKRSVRKTVGSPRVLLNRLSLEELSSPRPRISSSPVRQSRKQQMAKKRISMRKRSSGSLVTNVTTTVKKRKRTVSTEDQNESRTLSRRAAAQVKSFKEPSLREKMRRE